MSVEKPRKSIRTTRDIGSEDPKSCLNIPTSFVTHISTIAWSPGGAAMVFGRESVFLKSFGNIKREQ